MASLNSLNAVSGLFASMNTGTSGTNSLYSMDFSTYNSIRSGSYSKLMKSYYSDDSKRAETKNSFSSGVAGASDLATEKKNATSSRDNAAAVVDSVKDLRTSSLWEKKTKTDKEGNETSEYDMDEIYKKVNAFKESYNSLVTSAGKSSDRGVLNAASNMVNFTKANASVLKKVGISIDSDNKLSIDEDKFKKADVSTIKSVFTGAGSFGQSSSASASSVYGSAVSQLSKLQTQNSYTSTGAYSYVPVSRYNSFT